MVIVKLAIKDIIHEWLLSACLILAISSIIAPLLILFGLKYGTIQTLRTRLIEDPKSREIRSLSSASFTKDWFDTIQNNKGIAFVVPTTRQISSTVDVSYGVGNKTRLSILATAEGDPLLLENGAEIPDNKACVLTDSAAKELSVVVGDDITLTVRRIANGRSESGDLVVRVAGILHAEASSLKSVFLQLSVLEAVEDFKDGRAVPKYGWSGQMPLAYPVYDGAVVFIAEPLSKLEEITLVNNTGFTKIQIVNQEEVLSKLGYTLDGEQTAYLVSVQHHAAEEESLDALKRRLRGKNAIVVPWIKRISAELVTILGEQSSIPISLTSVETEIKQVITEFKHSDILQAVKLDDKTRFIIIPPSARFPEGSAVLKIKDESRELNVPVDVVHGALESNLSYASVQFAGMLNLFRYRNVRYSHDVDSLLLSRRGYAGFRMYAETIDDVESIQERLETTGVVVNTEAVRIAEVRRLDSYLSLIFWLIAAVGVVGGICALTASLYASVERKKKELNILRLLGFLKQEIIRFPIYQALLLAGSGLIFATSFFLIISMVINGLFRSHLRSAESLCRLSPFHLFVLISGVFLLSVLAAGFASFRATRLDPAEALRDE